MNSLQELNNFSNQPLEYFDDRFSGVIFDTLPPLEAQDQVLNIASTTLTVGPGIDIEEIINYQLANVRYRVEIITGRTGDPEQLPGSTINWDILPSGVVETQVGNVYTLSGINTVEDWYAVRSFTWNLPNDYADYPIWFLRAAIVWYDQDGNETRQRSWDVYDERFYVFAELNATSSIYANNFRLKTAESYMNVVATWYSLQGRLQLFEANLSSTATIFASGDDIDFAVANLSSTASITDNATRIRPFESTNNNMVASVSCTAEDLPFVTGMTTTRSYVANRKNYIFWNTTETPSGTYTGPVITDPEETTYTITFQSANFLIWNSNIKSYDPATEASNNLFSYTGTKAQCNSVLENLLFYPTKNYTGTGQTVNYTQYKTNHVTYEDASDFNFGSNDFTVEFWIRGLNSSIWSGDPFIIGNAETTGTDGWKIISGGAGNFYFTTRNSADNGTTNIVSTSPVSYTDFDHVAFVRSGNTMYAFKNGVLDNSASITWPINDSTNALGIAKQIGTAANIFQGWIDEIRISNTARYTSTFTPSTSAFTNDANTLLLMHFDASPIVDDVGSAARTPKKLEGGTGLDTSTKKFGASSGYFLGQNIFVPATVDSGIRTASFTVNYSSTGTLPTTTYTRTLSATVNLQLTLEQRKYGLFDYLVVGGGGGGAGPNNTSQLDGAGGGGAGGQVLYYENQTIEGSLFQMTAGSGGGRGQLLGSQGIDSIFQGEVWTRTASGGGGGRGWRIGESLSTSIRGGHLDDINNNRIYSGSDGAGPTYFDREPPESDYTAQGGGGAGSSGNAPIVGQPGVFFWHGGPGTVNSITGSAYTYAGGGGGGAHGTNATPGLSIALGNYGSGGKGGSKTYDPYEPIFSAATAGTGGIIVVKVHP